MLYKMIENGVLDGSFQIFCLVTICESIECLVWNELGSSFIVVPLFYTRTNFNLLLPNTAAYMLCHITESKGHISDAF